MITLLAKVILLWKKSTRCDKHQFSHHYIIWLITTESISRNIYWWFLWLHGVLNNAAFIVIRYFQPKLSMVPSGATWIEMPTGWRLLNHHDKCAVQQRDVHLHIYAFSSVAVPICLESKGLIVNLSIFSTGFHYVASNKIKTPGNTYISPANQACYLLLDWCPPTLTRAKDKPRRTHIKGTSFINGTHVRWSYRKMLGHRCIKNPVGKMGSITIKRFILQITTASGGRRPGSILPVFDLVDELPRWITAHRFRYYTSLIWDKGIL